MELDREQQEVAQTAARLIVDEGLDYASARRKALQEHGDGRRLRDAPSNEAIEDEVRAHIAIFCADTQPAELRALRKAQELVITMMLEVVLGKDRILTTYLNNVEWGEGVFGAQAAAQHYFRTNAATLGPVQAARLAVMLPAPKRFEKSPASPYVLGRSATIVARMGGVDLPD